MRRHHRQTVFDAFGYALSAGRRERCSLRLASDQARGSGRAGSSSFPKGARLAWTACEPTWPTTVCRLRHDQLLDAAHILPDSWPNSPAIVSNGLALCRLHHGAFDGYLMGIRPDLTVEVRQDVLDEVDGPTLVHALQGVHGGRIIVPHREDLRPDAEYLDERYRVFRAAG